MSHSRVLSSKRRNTSVQLHSAVQIRIKNWTDSIDPYPTFSAWVSSMTLRYSTHQPCARCWLQSLAPWTNKQTRFRHRHGGTGRCLDSHFIREPNPRLKYSVCCQSRMHCGSAWRRTKAYPHSRPTSSLEWPITIIHGSWCGKLLQTHRSQEVQIVFSLRMSTKLLKALRVCIAYKLHLKDVTAKTVWGGAVWCGMGL